MNNRERQEVGENMLEAIYSLHKAVTDAGGSPDVVPDYLHRPLKDFIIHVAAPNRIRFAHMRIYSAQEEN